MSYAYGLGLRRWQDSYGDWIGHSGGGDGQTTLMVYNPQNRVTLAMFTNVGNTPLRQTFATVLRDRIVSIVFD
jgi:hypothetical protein